MNGISLFNQKSDKMIEFTKEEIEEIKSCVVAVINEGFTTPPYRKVVYDLIEKLGITQEEAWQYDISRTSR